MTEKGSRGVPTRGFLGLWAVWAREYHELLGSSASPEIFDSVNTFKEKLKGNT